MRFVYLFASLAVMLLLSAGLNYEIKSLEKISAKKNLVRKEFESGRFISESFANACKGQNTFNGQNTCKGRGFESLVQWQKTCKAMWDLDYIGWSKADSFMNVENPEKGQLLYGRWIGPYGNGEIYYRVTDESEKS